ncbi:hypothetical protein GQ44DRAFT_617120 [Phaeosphaeriaceae sp. PMI808]|nr:hypothetical protein GQ44DRAFT_617120 [Phaeosphaeriaceae sp. PMI808]
MGPHLDYVFTVRRSFDTDGRFKDTYVDIKSRALCEALQELLEHGKDMSLVGETP